MHKRVMFLDIDGVLNNKRTFIKTKSFSALDPKNVKALRQVAESTQAVIVISSARRHGDDWSGRIRESLSEAGWSDPPIIGKTPVCSESRGEEIAAWLSSHPTDDFVIIDDETDMLPSQKEHFIHCNAKTGFTLEDADKILNRWN